jgi:hypothetical protein
MHKKPVQTSGIRTRFESNLGLKTVRFSGDAIFTYAAITHLSCILPQGFHLLKPSNNLVRSRNALGRQFTALTGTQAQTHLASHIN